MMDARRENDSAPTGPTPRVIALGGLDPRGGAGLVRDFVTAASLGAEAVVIATAWTDQSAAEVRGFEPRSPEAVCAALATAAEQGPSGAMAVKVGMVGTPGMAEAIAAALARFEGPVVFDPVLAASSGGSLFNGSPRALAPLLRRATLVTPNLAEAEALSGKTAAPTELAEAIRALGVRAVLIKGGHLTGAADDLLVDDRGARVFSAPRLPGPSPRGTGCALATAIAVALASGQDLDAALGSAKSWLHERIRHARRVGDEWHLG